MLPTDTKKTFMTLIIGALSFVCAMVWGNAILEAMQPVIEAGNGVVGLFIVAIVITLIVVVATSVLMKLLFRNERQECEAQGGTYADFKCTCPQPTKCKFAQSNGRAYPQRMRVQQRRY